MQGTLGGILERAAAESPDRVAIWRREKSVTFQALDRLANRFGNALLASGVVAGDRLAVLCRNSIEYAVAYFGAAKAGLISTHLSWRYTATELEYVLAKTEPSALVIDAALLPLLMEATSALLQPPSALLQPPMIIIVGDADDGTISFEDFVARGGDAPLAGPRPDEPAVIVFTSGTTGKPKGALSTHAARVLSALVAKTDFGLGPDDTVLVASPLYHAAGLFTWFQTAVAAQATSVFLANWNVGDCTDAVSAHKVTGAFMVPTQIALMLDSPEFLAENLRSLRLIVYGGAPVRSETIDRAEALLPWISFIQNYGLTEMGPLFSLQPADRHSRPGTIGRPNEFLEIALFAESGRRAAPGEIGEIASRGTHLMLGYFRDEDQTKEFFRAGDEWGWTGDLAVEDKEGYITLRGRAKDVIISGGVNVHPAEIEAVLMQHDAVLDCAAFGMPDPIWGELPAAEVVLHPATVATVDELLKFCTGRIAAFKRPRAILIVESLPSTAAGKLDRKTICQRNAGLKPC